MFVQCLGSGDAFGSGGRFNTSFYIRGQKTVILLDCGASTLIALKREGLSADDVDAIVITHLHGDHFGGLVFVLCEIIAVGMRKKPLIIIGPAETEQRALQSLACLYPGVKLRDDAQVQFIHYATNQTCDLDTWKLIPYPAIHSRKTNPHIVRIEIEDRIIAFSGDTEWTDDLIVASDGADLFICEASGYQVSVKQHLSVSKISEEQPRLRAKKVVLTHASEQVLRHLDEISLHVASDGEVLLDD
jgi:ribonuclease BN (tRNA processing enzyme)